MRGPYRAGRGAPHTARPHRTGEDAEQLRRTAPAAVRAQGRRGLPQPSRRAGAAAAIAYQVTLHIAVILIWTRRCPKRQNLITYPARRVVRQMWNVHLPQLGCQQVPGRPAHVVDGRLRGQRQDGGVRQVQLPCGGAGRLRGDREVTAPVVVEERREDAGSWASLPLMGACPGSRVGDPFDVGISDLRGRPGRHDAGRCTSAQAPLDEAAPPGGPCPERSSGGGTPAHRQLRAR